MARQKSYNINTKSGRRNIRDKHQLEYNQKSVEEKNEYDANENFGKFIVFIVAMIIGLIIILMGGKIK